MRRPGGHSWREEYSASTGSAVDDDFKLEQDRLFVTTGTQNGGWNLLMTQIWSPLLKWSTTAKFVLPW